MPANKDTTHSVSLPGHSASAREYDKLSNVSVARPVLQYLTSLSVQGLVLKPKCNAATFLSVQTVELVSYHALSLLVSHAWVSVEALEHTLGATQFKMPASDGKLTFDEKAINQPELTSARYTLTKTSH